MTDIGIHSEDRHVMNGFRPTGPPRPSHFDGRGHFLRRPRSSSATRTNIRFTEEKIILNVGGVRYQTFRATLKGVPGSRLNDLAENGKFFDEQRQEFFFDRSAVLFEYILNYYRTGELHFGEHICPSQVRKELEFWQIPETEMDDCCWLRYSQANQLDERRGDLRHLVDEAKLKQRDKIDELRQMPPADKTDVTKKIFDALENANIYPDLRLIGLSLKECSKDLLLFVVVLFLSSVFFASFIYIFEKSDAIHCFGAALWWSFVTMTTVGYGSIPPGSVLGCVTGTFCVLTGIIIITLPLHVVTRKLLELRLRLRENERLQLRDVRRQQTNTLGASDEPQKARGRESQRKKAK